MPRPYINALHAGLEQAFKDNDNDASVVTSLRDELKIRFEKNNKRKTEELLKQVENRLKVITQAGKVPAKSAEIPQPPSRAKETANSPSDPQPQTQLRTGLKPLQQEEPRPVFQTPLINNAKQAPSCDHEDGATPPRLGVMRKPGRISGVPEKRQFPLKNDVHLEVRKKAPLVEYYCAAVAALVAEIKAKKSGIKMVSLEDGVRVQLDGKEVGYQFPYDDEAVLFEGAAVSVQIGGIRSEGCIVAFMGNRIILSLQTDFGERIGSCIVRIDNTAMLEALRARLESISKGEATHFNVKLAEAVIENKGDEVPSNQRVFTATNDLNSLQRDAVSRCFANEVFYLWGPPGTGKTKTLSGLCAELLLGDKRILLCSNTNQAVDQVILALCKNFEKDNNKAIEEGQIVPREPVANATLAAGKGRRLRECLLNEDSVPYQTRGVKRKRRWEAELRRRATDWPSPKGWPGGARPTR